jgi:hypothetical protein
MAVAALVAAGCGGGGGGANVTHRAVDEGTGGELTCGECIVTGAGLNETGGIGWELTATPMLGAGAGPGFGGQGIAATGSVRLLDPATGIGLFGCADFHVDTILGCARSSDGTLHALVSGAPGPHTDRFFLAVSETAAGADLAFYAGPASGGPPPDGTVASLTLPVRPEDLHLDELDRCGYGTSPGGGTTAPEPGGTPAPPPPPTGTPPSGPFIPL